MIPSLWERVLGGAAVYQRGLVIDSQPDDVGMFVADSISKGIGD